MSEIKKELNVIIVINKVTMNNIHCKSPLYFITTLSSLIPALFIVYSTYYIIGSSSSSSLSSIFMEPSLLIQSTEFRSSNSWLNAYKQEKISQSCSVINPTIKIPLKPFIEEITKLSTKTSMTPPPFQNQVFTIAESNNQNELLNLTSIERAPYQIYLKQGLGQYYHFSESKEMFYDINKRFPELKRNIIQRNQYVCKNGICVVNDCEATPLHLKSSLREMVKSLHSLILSSLDSFEYDRKRNTAQFSGGYTTSDCNKYKSHRSTCLGNIKPFLFQQGSMDPSTMKKLALLMHKMCTTMQSKDSLYPSQEMLDNDTHLRHIWKLRTKLRMDFAKKLGLDSNFVEENISGNFPESYSIVSNCFIKPHRDTMNPVINEEDNTIAINCVLKVTQEMLNSKGLGKLLKNSNIILGKEAAFTLITYQRKVISDHCQFQYQLDSIKSSTSNPYLTHLIHSISNHVHDDLDYGRFWDCNNYLNDRSLQWINEDGIPIKCRQNRYDYCVIQPVYDKMVSIHVLICIN